MSELRQQQTLSAVTQWDQSVWVSNEVGLQPHQLGQVRRGCNRAARGAGGTAGAMSTTNPQMATEPDHSALSCGGQLYESFGQPVVSEL